MMILLSGCAPGITPTPLPIPPASTLAIIPPTPTPEPTQVGAFTSSFYGYSLELPDGWQLTRAGTMLMAPGQLPWAGESDAVDTFRGPDKKDFMVIGARSINANTKLEVWAQLVAEGTSGICQEQPSTDNQMQIGGVSAIIVVDGDCQGIDHLWLAVLHEGLGFQIVWGGGDREVFEQVRQSFTFTP
jgi:hypothetical protein